MTGSTTDPHHTDGPHDLDATGRPVVIVRGGPAPDPSVLAVLPPRPYVIAVDHGYDHAVALGIPIDVVVGDLDSITDTARTALEASGVEVQLHPTDKDATDLELALDLAVRRGRVAVTVIGGVGWDDRFDHVAAQLGLLAAPAWRGVALTAYLGRACVQPLHGGGSCEVHGRPGELVSIVPVGGPAIGVRTNGLRFPLLDETLDVFSTRGVSNELVAPTGSVSLRDGVVLIITPHALEGDQP